MLHFLSVPAEPHLEKAGDVWCVRLSKQNSVQTQLMKRGVRLCYSRQGKNKLESRTGWHRDFH